MKGSGSGKKRGHRTLPGGYRRAAGKKNVIAPCLGVLCQNRIRTGSEPDPNRARNWARNRARNRASNRALNRAKTQPARENQERNR